MGGNRRKGIVLQDRDRRLLRELTIMQVLDREQAQVVAGFRSITRANTRLLALTRTGLLKRFYLATVNGGKKAVYSLTKQGTELAGTEHA